MHYDKKMPKSDPQLPYIGTQLKSVLHASSPDSTSPSLKKIGPGTFEKSLWTIEKTQLHAYAQTHTWT